MAAAITPAPWIAIAGFRGKSDGSSFGGWIQQHERVHIDVPQAVGDDANALFGEWDQARLTSGNAALGEPLELTFLQFAALEASASTPFNPPSLEKRFHPGIFRTYRRQLFHNREAVKDNDPQREVAPRSLKEY